jgi:hypothetical protein
VLRPCASASRSISPISVCILKTVRCAASPHPIRRSTGNPRGRGWNVTVCQPCANCRKPDKLSQPVEQKGRRYSGFIRGELNIGGLQNKTLRRSSVRTHGLGKKAGNTYKYYVTAFGKELVATAFKLREPAIIPSSPSGSPSRSTRSQRLWGIAFFYSS